MSLKLKVGFISHNRPDLDPEGRLSVDGAARYRACLANLVMQIRIYIYDTHNFSPIYDSYTNRIIHYQEAASADSTRPVTWAYRPITRDSKGVHVLALLAASADKEASDILLYLITSESLSFPC
jgi:hypothetical protein